VRGTACRPSSLGSPVSFQGTKWDDLTGPRNVPIIARVSEHLAQGGRRRTRHRPAVRRIFPNRFWAGPGRGYIDLEDGRPSERCNLVAREFPELKRKGELGSAPLEGARNICGPGNPRGDSRESPPPQRKIEALEENPRSPCESRQLDRPPHPWDVQVASRRPEGFAPRRGPSRKLETSSCRACRSRRLRPRSPGFERQ